MPEGRIVVAAGTNGAGKSSIVGEFLGARGGGYFDPDAWAKRLVAQGRPAEEANAEAWKLGFDGLRRAIDLGLDFTFETTLGGSSIVKELHRAVDAQRDVRVFYVGLASPELHVARVRARVARGGHAIPESKIRERYGKSLANLVGLLGKAREIHLFDNSEEGLGGAPLPRRVFRMRGVTITEPDRATLLRETNSLFGWAKPLVAAALALAGSGLASKRR